MDDIPPTRRSLPSVLVTAIRALLLTVAAAFFALHFVHLRADFPNFSPWMDWSKYTDEGWYGDAAIRFYQRGAWYVAGDFNPAVALPVWPLMEALLFRFTGVSLTAVRALTVCVFGGTLLAGYALMRRWSTAGRTPLAPAAGVLLLTVSPFCFVFMRMAILEPMLVLLTMLAMVTASSAKAREDTDWKGELRANARPTALLAVLLPAMVLTKTTGLFLAPAVGWMLWAALGFHLRSLRRVGSMAGGCGLALWLAYFFGLVRPHYLLDYRYLFSANGYSQIKWSTAVSVLRATFLDGRWMGEGIYWAAVACMVMVLGVSLARWRMVRRSPLAMGLVLWAVGYAAFLAYHDNLQPRYYLVVAVPLMLLVPVTVEEFVLPFFTRWKAQTVVLTVALLALAAVALPEGKQTVSYARHPTFTLLSAAHRVDDVIQADARQDPGHNRLILSISGSDISLMTGLPSICDDFGTDELVDRVRRYRPGWYAAWNEIDDDKMEALEPFYSVERVAAFPAMDDSVRNVLILYKLEDKTEVAERKSKAKLVPKRLRTKVGQQPSTNQLQH